MHTTVADLMSEPVLTVDRDDDAGEVAQAMVESEVHSVVVIDEACHPVGILTSTDYLRMTAESVNPHTEAVESVMTTGIVTTTADEPVEAAAARMAEHGLGHLPVVDSEDVVTGILSATDLTAHLGAA
jgi:CBS domain-containing protein